MGAEASGGCWGGGAGEEGPVWVLKESSRLLGEAMSCAPESHLGREGRAAGTTTGPPEPCSDIGASQPAGLLLCAGLAFPHVALRKEQ